MPVVLADRILRRRHQIMPVARRLTGSRGKPEGSNSTL